MLLKTILIFVLAKKKKKRNTKLVRDLLISVDF